MHWTKWLGFFLILVLGISPAFAQSSVVTQPSSQAATNFSSTISVTNTFQSVFAASAKRQGCSIQNNGSNTMWVYFGDVTGATKAKSFILAPTQSILCGSLGVVAKDQVSITGTATDAFAATQDGSPTIGAGGGGTISGTVTANQGTAGTNAQAWWVQIGDTTNGPAAVKAASTAPVATDKAVVVAISPNGQLPAGQATSAQSVPVVIASDQSVLPVGGNQITVQVAQTVTASSAYASGNAIGGLMTISNAARISGSSGTAGTGGLLQSIVMNIKSAQTTPVDVFIFNSNPSGTTCTDKTALAIAAADFDKVLGVAHMTDFTSGGTPSDGQSQNLAMPYALTFNTTLYACAVTRSTPTYAATTDVSFGFRMLRN